MNKKTKFLSILTALVLSVSCLAAFASEYDTMLIDDAAAVSEYKITLDGTELEKTAKTFDSNIMLPLRSLCEALDMKVTWIGETSTIIIEKLPVYITCTPYADGYTFAKTAPQLLGTAPVLENGTTYVPYNFVSQILTMDAQVAYDTIVITSEAKASSDATLSQEYKVTVDGVQLDKNAKNFDGNIMLPLRDLCEALDMEVLWDDENSIVTVTNLPEYFRTYADGYTFAITDPVFSGMSAVLENDIIYVPHIFVSDVLHLNYEIADDTVAITTEAEASYDVEAPKAEALIQSSGEGTISVYDFARGEVVVNITEETLIVDAEGKEIDAKDITVGAIAEIEYADFMTMSLPPITNAVKVSLKTQELYTTVSGTIDSVLNEEFGKQIILGEELENQIVLNLADTTIIIDADGEAADADALSKATQLTAVVSQAQTFSIPPQSSAYFIRIEK